MKAAIYIDGKTGDVSDGYHTFDELYDHRIALFICLAKIYKHQSWISRTHHDGKGIEGWFIMGVNLPQGAITYHLPNRFWELVGDIPWLDKAPEWDGHTSKDVVDRLLKFAKELSEGDDLGGVCIHGF